MSATQVPRIGANLLWLVPGVVGGSEEYTTRLLAATADRLGPTVDVTLFVNRLFPAAHPELVKRFRTVVGPVSGGHKATRVAAETTWLAVQARRRHLDLVHHFGGLVPLVRGTKTVVTLHDLQPLAQPEHFRPAKRAFLRVMLPWSMHAADRIVTLTEHTKEDLHRQLRVDPHKVTIVPSGIRLSQGPVDPLLAQRVRHRYRLADRPFLLYPAITYPHKNHETLIRAFAQVWSRHPDVVLVLTGGSARCEAEVRALIDVLGLRSAVRRPGRIPAEDLDVLYREATALAFPSTFEGFGLPVLEAMSRGCPVIAAAATALPEVIGEAGVLLSARDVAQWSVAMERMIDEPELRATLRDAGYARAQAFTWEAAADALGRLWWDVLA